MPISLQYSGCSRWQCGEPIVGIPSSTYKHVPISALKGSYLQRGTMWIEKGPLKHREWLVKNCPRSMAPSVTMFCKCCKYQRGYPPTHKYLKLVLEITEAFDSPLGLIATCIQDMIKPPAWYCRREISFVLETSRNNQEWSSLQPTWFTICVAI